MAENIIKDLNIQLNSAFTLSSTNEPVKRVLNFNYDPDSYSGIANSFESIFQNKSQFIHKEIGENKNDSDTKNEDILLGIRDEEGNIVCNNDEYDLTEEEENYLLNDNSNGQCNSKIKYNVQSCDAIDEETSVTNLDPENISISDMDEEEILVINEDDHDNSSLYQEYITEPTAESIFKVSYLSPKSMVDSSNLDDVKGSSDEEVNFEEKDSDREFDLTKVMSSDETRKIYMGLLKDKTQSLLTSYNKYKNIVLQNPLETLKELERKKADNKETNLQNNHSKTEETNLLYKNAKVSDLNIQPLTGFVERANDDSIDQFKTQTVNEAEEVIECPVNDRIQDKSVENVKQSYGNGEIERNFSDKINVKVDYKQAKAINNETTSDTLMVHETSNNEGELTFCIAKESSLHNFTHLSRSDKSNCSLSFRMEQQQNIENSCDLQKCSTSDPFSKIKRDLTDTKRNVLNKIYQAFNENNYTKILNSSLYMGYEAMNLQSTNESLNALKYSVCEKVASDTEETSRNTQLRIPALRQSKRISALRQTNLNSKTLKEKQTKMNDNTQTILDLFSLNNKIATCILWGLLSDQFKTGAFLTDIMRYLRREKALKMASKLRKDVEKFLKAAVDAGIVQMKCRKYMLTGEKGICSRIKSTKKKFHGKHKALTATSRNLRKRQIKNK